MAILTKKFTFYLKNDNLNKHQKFKSIDMSSIVQTKAKTQITLKKTLDDLKAHGSIGIVVAWAGGRKQVLRQP